MAQGKLWHENHFTSFNEETFIGLIIDGAILIDGLTFGLKANYFVINVLQQLHALDWKSEAVFDYGKFSFASDKLCNEEIYHNSIDFLIKNVFCRNFVLALTSELCKEQLLYLTPIEQKRDGKSLEKFRFFLLHTEMFSPTLIRCWIQL